MDRFARYSWFTLAFNLAVILWGALVRATGSGAGCGAHWPLCNGEVVPREPALATLIELSHRATSGLALLLVVLLLVLAFRCRPAGHPARSSAVVSLLLMLTEAAVGAGLVLFQLVAHNASMARAMFMAVHLVNTFFLVAALALTAHFAAGGSRLRIGWTPRSRLLAVALFGLVVAGVSGAVAALGDTLYPSDSLEHALAQDLSTTAHLLIRLRLLHPLLAVLAALGVALAAWRLESHSPAAQRWANSALVLSALQLAAGVTNVLLLAPVWMQLVHLLLADLLWVAVVLMGATALGEAGSSSGPTGSPAA